MINLVAVGVIALAALIHATLQLGTGALLLLYHASLGRHIRVRTKRLASRYITGVMTMILLALGAACFAIMLCFNKALPASGLLVLVCGLTAVAVCAWVFYYRRGTSTELWLPRVVSKYINRRAKLTNRGILARAAGRVSRNALFPSISDSSGQQYLDVTPGSTVCSARGLHCGGRLATVGFALVDSQRQDCGRGATLARQK